ncbi:Hypothetical protein A7982_11949 [Minicystis rosea]|nr:Hypothetical protein A7982_11949 [Minicystis rosea]
MKALAAGLSASLPLAFVYSYIIVYIPIVGVITFALTAGFGALLGFLVGQVLHAGKVRSQAAALAAAVPVSLFALWAAWVTWVYALMHRADVDVAFLDLAANPGGLWNLINVINDKGAWNLKGFTPTGGLLWGLWALEAAIIVGLAVLVAYEAVNVPFCEPCDVWCAEHKAMATLGSTTKRALAPRLEQGDYAVLRETPHVSDLAFTRLDLHQCPTCQGTATLSATSVTVTVKKDKRETSETVLFKYLLVPPADLATVTAMVAAGQAQAAAEE